MNTRVSTVEPETAWAAGLFDGEGCVTVCNGRLRLSLKMVDRDCVLRFCAAVRGGKVYGPYKNSSAERDGYKRKPFSFWVATGPDVAAVASKLAPLLSQTRLDALRSHGVL